MGVFKVFRVSIFLIMSIFGLFVLLFRIGLSWFNSVSAFCSRYFIFDNVSFYMVLLVFLLGVYSVIVFRTMLLGKKLIFLSFRLLFSVLCFCVRNSVLFWCFYELSMLPLLYLIFSESPYSERFLAGWYFSGYLLITRLPLLLILLYLSIINDSFRFVKWDKSFSEVYLHLVLTFIFFTKVPLIPFHTWLPIVHAEATSIVSIFLRGYIMKLGLLGVYRCSYFVFDFNFVFYLLICCLASIFFIIAACGELDGKRWLALLRLAHIVVPLLGFFVSDWEGVNFSFLYSLGHGLSAGLVFGLLWYFYDVSKRRNWLLLKSVIKSRNFIMLFIIRMLRLCSFPTTLQFFCEVCLVKLSSVNLFYLVYWFLYLFLGGLVPLVLCGHLIIRSEWYEAVDCHYYCYSYFLRCLIIWCFFGMFII